jgi:hypothetical protein
MVQLECAEHASPRLPKLTALGVFGFLAFWGVAGFVAMSLL